MLHTTTDLEVGYLFINKYTSTSYKKDVLQVWLLLPAPNGEGFQWRQVCCICASGHATEKQ